MPLQITVYKHARTDEGTLAEPVKAAIITRFASGRVKWSAMSLADQDAEPLAESEARKTFPTVEGAYTERPIEPTWKADLQEDKITPYTDYLVAD